ncbi:hypothetical protein VPFG_00363 [Vibrio phage nt-1]|uniref:Uncharacterized protein n=1 Tax=Vibrio phage nt-1 TaxID=115992 RepID=R9TJ15_9CAUD|nr:hypothetical protein VPFG_00363 [Vibrio phage nt-1]AGN30360.1 hypothetical protein VPFG_00363 [Vibrio phage nt-1]
MQSFKEYTESQLDEKFDMKRIDKNAEILSDYIAPDPMNIDGDDYERRLMALKKNFGLNDIITDEWLAKTSSLVRQYDRDVDFAHYVDFLNNTKDMHKMLSKIK